MLSTKCIFYIILIFYCIISLGIFIDRSIYLIRCLCSSKFRSRQPALWMRGCIQDMIFSITLTWLPLLIIKTIIDAFD